MSGGARWWKTRRNFIDYTRRQVRPHRPHTSAGIEAHFQSGGVITEICMRTNALIAWMMDPMLYLQLLRKESFLFHPLLYLFLRNRLSTETKCSTRFAGISVEPKCKSIRLIALHITWICNKCFRSACYIALLLLSITVLVNRNVRKRSNHVDKSKY